MLFQNYPYFYLFFISSAIAGFTTYYAWKRRTVRSSHSFIILMSLVTWYVFFYGCEVITTDPSLHILFLKIEYLAIPWISGFLILFSLEFGGYVQKVTKKQLFTIFLLPSLLFVCYFTNSIHHLYYQDISSLLIDNLTVISITPGILYYLLVLMNTVAILTSFTIMIQVYRNASRIFRSQLILVLVSMGILIAGMAFFLLLPRRYPDFDIFPLFLSFVGLMLLTAIFRFQFFDLMHIPYRNFFGYLEEGIIVLDPDNRVLEMNPKALFLLDLEAVKVQGEDLISIDTLLNEHVPVLTGTDTVHIRIHKKKGLTDSYLFVEMYPVFDSFSRIECRMIIIRDITEITKTHMALTEAGKKLNLLNSITRHDILNQVAVISGYAELLSEECTDGSPHKVDLERIKKSSDSIRNLIQFTATYQNLGVSDPVWLDVSATVLKA